jgi:carbohydrate-binding DOMON domain-containing protein
VNGKKKKKHAHFRQSDGKENSNTPGTEFKISHGDLKLKVRCCKRENSVVVMFTFQDFSSHVNQYRFF